MSGLTHNFLIAHINNLDQALRIIYYIHNDKCEKFIYNLGGYFDNVSAKGMSVYA